jgi:hypothetical protein
VQPYALTPARQLGAVIPATQLPRWANLEPTWEAVVVSRPDRPPKSAGTYGVPDLLRHPSRILRPATPSDGQADVEALRSGDARTTSCFLRGSFDPYPRHLKQGTLELVGTEALWRPYFSLHRDPIPINMPISSVETRPADHREPNVKKGGKALGLIGIPAFLVVTCGIAAGSLDLVVPSADEPLVATFFRASLTFLGKGPF